MATTLFFANHPSPQIVFTVRNQTPRHKFLHLSVPSLFCPCPVSSLPFNRRPATTRPPPETATAKISRSSAQTASTPIKRKQTVNPVISEGRDEDLNRLICPGCGVFMQDKDPNLPGFYKKRAFQKASEALLDRPIENFDEFDSLGDRNDEKDLSFTDFDSEYDESDAFSDELSREFEDESKNEEERLETRDGIDWDSDWEIEDEEEKLNEELDGFAAAGVGYGNVTEETLRKQKKGKMSKSERKKKARMSLKDEEAVTVCARCHSLRNYGQVKNEKVENLIPDFDFDRLIATRLMKPTGSSNVVVVVVDCVDFDGSFPKRAARSLFKALEVGKKEAKLSRLPKLVLVATKLDLLPSQISPPRLDRWLRNRGKANGAPKLSGVFLVSAHKDLGVRNLLSFIKELADPRGNVWVIGAQNAGKSTLINAFANKGGVQISRLTEAAVPGTTLGILRIGGILPAKAKMYDTPGLLHPYLMGYRLNRDEQKMVEIRKELKPRTYRMKAGQSVHLGGLVRLGVIQASVETIYTTVWASPNVSLHLGKVENADEIWRKHAGIRLQPPIGEERVPELGQWMQKEFKVSGISWEVNSLDIAVAGLGWFSLGLKGEATVMMWTYEGIETVLREPLVLDRAPFLERPGFLLPKAISDAIGNESKRQAEIKKQNAEKHDSVFEPSI